MIVKISNRIFIADDSKRMAVDVELIRAGGLFHVCKRFVTGNREVYVCEIVFFNYSTGNYYCSNLECNKILPFQDVVADGLGTGWEGHA